MLIACGASPPREPIVVAPEATATAMTPVASANVVKIVVLGDSLAAGFGLAEGDAFPAVVGDLLRAAGHRVQVVNAGVSGDTSAGGLSRIDWILQQEPDVVALELGANDALRGQPLESTENNLREIVRRCRAAGARVAVLGMDVPTSYGPDYAGGFAEIYGRIARDEKVVLVPGFIRQVGADPSLMQPDGLHPTAEGQRRLAENLAPALGALIAEMSVDTW